MNMTIADAARLLGEHDDMLILSHRKPDGDTVGSCAALCTLLRLAGKTAWLHANEDFTPRYASMVDGLIAPPGFAPRFVISCDIASVALLPDSAAPYAGRVDLCLDHHATNSGFAAHTVLDPRAAATGELVFDLVHAFGIVPNGPIMHGIYVAISTDTGCFRFSNTTPRTLRIAAECMEAGVDVTAVNRTFFVEKSRARLRLESHILGDANVYEGGSVFVSTLTRAQIAEYGATEDDIDNLSTILMQFEGIACGILLVENRALTGFKASVRSRAPLDASMICAPFGGGGHPRAAGCTIADTAEACERRLVEAVRAAAR